MPLAFNLLDRPSHQDSSEDTYCTLTAVDSAVRVLDAAKGIEERTRRLCDGLLARRRAIFAIANRLDRECGDPFDSFIAMLTILKLPHSHAMFPGHGRF